MRALCDFSEKPRGAYHCYCPKFQARNVRLGGTEPLALGASSETQASPGKVPTTVCSQRGAHLQPHGSPEDPWGAVDTCARPGPGRQAAVLSAPTTSPCRRPCGHMWDSLRGLLDPCMNARVPSLAQSCAPHTRMLAFRVSLCISIPPILRSGIVNGFEARGFFLKRKVEVSCSCPSLSAGLPGGPGVGWAEGPNTDRPTLGRDPGPDSGARMSRAPREDSTRAGRRLLARRPCAVCGGRLANQPPRETAWRRGQLCWASRSRDDFGRGAACRREGPRTAEGGCRVDSGCVQGPEPRLAWV